MQRMRRAAELVLWVLSGAFIIYCFIISILFYASACGPASPGVRGPQEPLPPTTQQACERAIDCAAVDADRLEQCVACLETVADQWNERAHELYGNKEIPPLEKLPCRLAQDIATSTNLDACAYEGWYGPGPRRPPLRAEN